MSFECLFVSFGPMRSRHMLHSFPASQEGILSVLVLPLFCIDAMLRVHATFAMLCSAGMCAVLPVLDLPREAVTDVNKPPFPIVNVIADQPVTVMQVDQLRGTQSGQRSLLERVVHAQQEFETSIGADLEAQSRQLDKLRQMSARIGVVAKGAR